MENNIIKIPKKGDDGYKVISVRIKENTLKRIDCLANETNNSRNEIVNILLEHSVNRVEIE